MKKSIILCFLIIMTPMLLSAAPKPELWPHWKAHNSANTEQVDHSAWGQFLAKHLVTDHPAGINRLHYSSVTPSDKQALDTYLDKLQGLLVSALNRDEQKAYWINLYNALTVKVVLDQFPVKSIRDINISPGWFNSGPWDAKLLLIEGENLSLNDIEHRILRPIWQDNRVHYAVNCASLGCPNLQTVPFTASNTRELLDQAARDYINHPRGAQLVDNKLTVSSIYDWFQIDFGGNEAEVITHLRQYATAELKASLDGRSSIDNYSYNWQLND